MSPTGFLFELSGGALCLDFVNTVDKRPTPGRTELLRRYDDLLSWAVQSGAISARQAAVLEREAARRPREAQAALERARSVRETLFALFSAASAGRRLAAADLQALDAEMTATWAHLRLAPGPGASAQWTWTGDPALDRPLWPVLRSAAELLTSDDTRRLRECAAEKCAWLFIDRSKNQSRRWCDMSVCGNRDKVRRHRERRAPRPRPASKPAAAPARS